MTATYGNEPIRTPEFQGIGGRAWHVKTPETALEHQKQAACGSFLVHAPNAHPLWSWYAVQCIHLRQLDGQPPAHFQFPGASHEWMVLALDPREPIPDVDRWNAPGTPPMRHLEPIDQCWQFIVADDEQAFELCELTVRCIVEQGVSPDQDLRSWWKAAIANTAEHIRLGGHPEGRAHV